MSYLCKKRNICLWTLNIVKIQKTLNKHSVTLSILHCSGLFCEISPSTQPSTCLSFVVSRRTANHLWHLPRARSEPVQTSNVRDADNTHYSIIYVFYVCILKYIAITYTHICGACLTSYQKFGTNQAETQWKMFQQLERAGWNREAVVKEIGQCTRKTLLESELDLNPFLLLCDLTQCITLSKPCFLYLSNINLNLHCKFVTAIK